MATAKNILIIFLLGHFCRAEKAVFLSDKSASGVLVRPKRYNSGKFEELQAGNLERECIEEKCNFEEAREVFENDDKTIEFWKQYIDGDQCVSNPCLNGGVCKDEMSAYVCWCSHGYRGKNCEFELPITCTINNGGCQQMCRENAEKKVICSCASGYKLGADGQSCEEIVKYPCGKVTAPEAIPKDETRTILDPEDYTYNNSSTEHHNSTVNVGVNSDDIVPVTVDPNVRIVGGTDSLKGEFPWQVTSHQLRTMTLGDALEYCKNRHSQMLCADGSCSQRLVRSRLDGISPRSIQEAYIKPCGCITALEQPCMHSH